MAIIMDGKSLAKKILQEVKTEIGKFNTSTGLAVIIVGDNPASKVYVKNKKLDCDKCGIQSHEFSLASDIGEKKLIELIHSLNKKEDIHGILVQLPLPDGYNTRKIISAISPQKDVDAFCTQSIGEMFLGDENTFLPCTPAGVMALFNEYNIQIQGKHCVVIGHSNIVGKPMSLMLLQQNATVTTCHIFTDDLKKHTLMADIIICAVGKINLITKDMVKNGAVIIDIGINRTDSGICGDVDFNELKDIASYITPVPGGVGPMTRAMLMKNTLLAKRRLEK